MLSISTRIRTLTAMALLPVLAGCAGSASSTPASPERPVQVQRVSFQPAGENREFVGVMRARYETDLGFRVAGKITMRTVSIGDRVHVGDIIARLEPRDLKLQVASAEAEFSAATSNRAQAASDERRFASLSSHGSVAMADYERKKAAKDEADARLNRAQDALELARNQLTYTELKADADGVITATLAEPGQVVAIGQAVVRLAQRGQMEADVALPEGWLEEARASRATVRLWSNPNRQFEARLRELAPQADASTRTYSARFVITNPDQTIALGMTATVTLSHADRDVAVAKLPLAAVLNRGTGPAVYVVSEASMLELHPVTISSFTGDAALISSGVRDGENVVTLGVQQLVPGRKVRMIDAR
jgi:RND family efflux transporter MFP subunit